MKKCSKCKKVLPLTCFGKDKRASNGLRSQCKECEKVYRINGEKNRDLDKKHAYAKRYREAHKDKERERLIKWKKENPEKMRGHRTATKLNNRCKGKIDQSITLEKLYLRDGGICQICGKPCNYNDYIVTDKTVIVGNDYPSIDHIRPLSKGGDHTWDNIQLAHKICNIIKRDN